MTISGNNVDKHTPGPWHLFEKNRLCIESATGNVALCNLARNSEADARLIAAAPDLLKALRLTMAALEGKPCRQQAIDDANAAIAKATNV